VRRQVDAARTRYEGSWVEAVANQLKDVHFFDWTLIFGAELLWSALPFIILLSSLANERIDDDLSRHVGLNAQGAHIVRTLFRSHPTHAVEPLLTGFIFTFAGIVAVVASLQVLYERFFELEHRGWRDLPRYIVWTVILFAALAGEGAVSTPERRAGGPGLERLLGFLVVTLFFWWTIHFLLDGRVPWRRLVRPALVTGVLWLVMAIFSSAYFSSVLIEDSHLYGTIGVVFTLLTWFIIIGSVIVLGGAIGAVWEKRSGSDR
jgi:membrane protein